jgi:GDP-L-fucose synthase
MEQSDRIFIAGAETLAGAALLRALRMRGYIRIIGCEMGAPDLTDFVSVDTFFTGARPQYVFLVGGKSGGIQANEDRPADLMLDNLVTTCNVLRAAHMHGVQKLLYLASSCCYPRECPQPMKVEYLMTGPLEVTNVAYATAKIAGIGLCAAYRRQYDCRFITGIPANVFGPGDNFDPNDSHVIPALIRKMQEAKRTGASFVEVWGSGHAEREFISADDVADACIFLMERYDGLLPINIGAASHRFSIKALAASIRAAVGYTGEVRFDSSRPDGMPRKILDSTVLQGLGWLPRNDFAATLSATYEYYVGLEKRSGVSHV